MKTRRGIQSIEVGGQLLKVLVAEGKPMALRDIAKQADMPTAKAHPYLVSFCNLNLVKQDAVTGLYELGPFALQMGLVFLNRLDAVQVARPIIKDLADTSGQSVAIAVWGNMGPTIVAMEESRYPIHVNLRVGAVMSLMDTATGKAFAAFLPPKMTEKLAYEHDRSTQSREQQREMVEAFQKTLSEVREHMIARTLSYPVPGINALSAPVFNHDGHIVLALTAMGPESVCDASWESPLAQQLKAAAQHVSEYLGFQEGGS